MRVARDSQGAKSNEKKEVASWSKVDSKEKIRMRTMKEVVSYSEGFKRAMVAKIERGEYTSLEEARRG